MIELKDGGKYVRRDGKVVTVAKSDHPVWSFSVNGYNAYRKDGTYHASIGVISDCDLVSEYQPPFTIAAGNYYRTRDGRKAYVACGPVMLPMPEYEDESEYYCFGFVDNPDDYESFHWSVSGREDHLGNRTPSDLIALWHPETLTDPITGKKYRVAEEVA